MILYIMRNYRRATYYVYRWNNKFAIDELYVSDFMLLLILNIINTMNGVIHYSIMSCLNNFRCDVQR